MSLFFKKNKQTEKNNQSKIGIKKNNTFVDEIATAKTVESMYGLLSKRIPNPDEILRKTGKSIAFFKTIAVDSQVATCIESRSAGVTSLEYKLKYSDNNKKYADFYNKLIKNIDIYILIKDILKAPAYGYQPIEIIWHYKDGYIVPQKITAKPQEWFFFNNDNQLCFKKKGFQDGYIITEEMKKFLCPVKDDDYLNPYGHGYLSRCFWDVAFKKGSLEFWVRFAEKFGMPYVIAKYEQGTSAKEIDDLLDAADQMVQDAVAAIPNNSSIEIIEAAGKTASAEIYRGLIDVCDASISKNILGQTLTTESGGTGSYALGQVHYQVRQDIIDSDKRLCITQINKLLKWIHELNFGDEDAPEIDLFAKGDVNKTLAERDQILTNTGLKLTKSYYIKAYGFSEEDIIISGENTNDFAENNHSIVLNNNPQNNIDDFINSFTDVQLEDIISEKILPIIKNFAEVKDPQKALDDLAVLYPEKDSQSLEETLTKAIFLSNIWGQINND